MAVRKCDDLTFTSQGSVTIGRCELQRNNLSRIAIEPSWRQAAKQFDIGRRDCELGRQQVSLAANAVVDDQVEAVTQRSWLLDWPVLVERFAF